MDRIELSKHADTLKTLYFLSEKEKDPEIKLKDRNKFFDAFPSSFGRFDSLYGYHPSNSNLGVLYNESDMHIGLIFKCKENEEKLFKKIINLSIYGKWDADAIGYFQEGLNEVIPLNLKKTIKILHDYSDDKIFSFWHFYFDGPHPDQTISKELEKIKSQNQRIYKLMILAHEDVLKNNCEGH